jgi:cytochrome b involved in lipid metabolism
MCGCQPNAAYSSSASTYESAPRLSSKALDTTQQTQQTCEPSTRIAVDATSGSPYIVPQAEQCDACSCCDDVCELSECEGCASKRAQQQQPSAQRIRFTMCEVRRHNTTGSAWLLCGDTVYDVTSYLELHPGGKRSILRRCGGADCSSDMSFHSKGAQRQWKKYAIGKLVSCACESKTRRNSSSSSSAANSNTTSPCSSCPTTPSRTVSAEVDEHNSSRNSSSSSSSTSTDRPVRNWQEVSQQPQHKQQEACVIC